MVAETESSDEDGWIRRSAVEGEGTTGRPKKKVESDRVA